jgi:hypothetical protein
MNKVESLKSQVDNWLLGNSRYVIANETSMEHPEKKGLKTFNTSFSDNERKIRYTDIRYTITGYENETGQCAMVVEATLYTGLREDVQFEKNVGRYKLDVKNVGLSAEAILKLSTVYQDEVEFEIEDVLDIIMDHGINNLVY